MDPTLIDSLIIKNKTKIIFLIMDGLGGIPMPGKNKTELETANTPNMDELARKSICGLLDPVGPGITPGSGPAHFALFGYDPVRNNIGRGLLEAAGIDYPMTEDDLLIRINFATVDEQGVITDRRAGRIDTDTNKRICRKLQDNVKLAQPVEFFFEPVKEHRAVLVLRAKGPRREDCRNRPPKDGAFIPVPRAARPRGEEDFGYYCRIDQKRQGVLSDEKKANMLLLRGYSKYKKFPSIEERFGLKALAIASYPMYRGIARLLGMTIAPLTESIEAEISELQKSYDDYDFFFIHVKPTDSRGEDGNFEAKVKVIETVDSLIPKIVDLKPDVLVITGDHSTPAALASHSWHPVPVILSSANCRPDRVEQFWRG